MLNCFGLKKGMFDLTGVVCASKSSKLEWEFGFDNANGLLDCDTGVGVAWTFKKGLFESKGAAVKLLECNNWIETVAWREFVRNIWEIGNIELENGTWDCPSALEHASHDDINPLCNAALKNDRKLFFKLIHLGLDVNKASEYRYQNICLFYK